MRIDDNFAPSSDLHSAQVDRAQQLERQGQTERTPDESERDSVTLSPLGSRLSEALKTDRPEVIRQVQQLQQAITNGTFLIPADQVARSIVNATLQGD